MTREAKPSSGTPGRRTPDPAASDAAAQDPAGQDPAAQDEALLVWQRLRTTFGAARRRRKVRPEESPDRLPFGSGREPKRVAGALDEIAHRFGWVQPLAQRDLAAAWREIAGEETAAHAEVVGVDDGVLVVRCDSTAWATQLTIMRTQIAERIAREHPEAGVESIRFQGPNTTSWNRGPRSVPGRGPRDTYG